MQNRNLTDEDVEAIAIRFVHQITAKLAASEPPPESLPAAGQPQPEKPLPSKLAFTLKELAAELGISKATISRLDARGLLKSLPYIRTKVYSRKEVERFLADGSAQR